MEPYYLHPISVHFPIALLMTALVFELSSLKLPHRWLPQAATALLIAGTIFASISVGLGLLAEETVPHVPDAWEVLYRHKILGFWTAGFFIFLCLWRFFKEQYLKPVFLLIWIASVILLMTTAYHGGELVFHFGVGYQK